MPTRPPYPAEYKAELVRLVREEGRSPNELAREFEPSVQSIINWVAQAEIDTCDKPGLSSDEKAELKRLRSENRVLKMEKEILGKSSGLLRSQEQPDPIAVFEFVHAEKANFPIAHLCRMFGVTRQGYYAWRKRPPCERRIVDAAYTAVIKKIHTESRSTYGAPRIHAELADDYNIRCSRKRVARLMRQAGLVGCHRRKKVWTTKRDESAAPAPDLVKRDFSAKAPDQLWVADITYVPTLAGFGYLATVLDVFSRRIVGWSYANHMRTELIVDAIDMAVEQRKPGRGLIHHSDQGTQYTSLDFGRRCRQLGIDLSMGSVGDCYDNSMAESFFASLETELLYQHRFRSHTDARYEIMRYLDWYNTRRRHSSLDMQSPINYELTAA
ncbi:IS3 family transposase [Acidimicrobiales bacterium]|nr:IS3 family transposase [Acidimicrobiales bacterium]